MKQAEIKKNILKIATDVFRDTQVLFAYLYGSYAVNQAHQFSDLDIGIYVPRLSRREKLNLEMTLALKIDKKLKQGPASDVRIINSFLEDKILIGSAKYYLQTSIECCLDVANHIIASERYRSPKDYADPFSNNIKEFSRISTD